MERCPEWLGPDLVAGTLPWAEGIATSLATFLERYPLHDSGWIGLYAEPQRRATLLLRWDALRAEGAGVTQGPASGWPVLAVRFDALDRCEVRLGDGRIVSAVSGPTSRAADWHRTHLVDRQGGDATLVHWPGVRLLGLSPTREVLSLLVPAAAGDLP